MLIRLWSYFRGYVIIEVSGFSVERFVNLAVHKGVYVWDVEYLGSKVMMKVSIKGFKKLRECARKTKCRFRIIEKCGYPFVAHRYRKRKILAGGILFFVACMYLLSSFIWLVEIEGNDRIEYSDIIDFCGENGLKAGAFKHSISKKEMESLMISHFPDISFLNINIKGTKATIVMTEILPRQEIIDRETPCNIVAKKDGVVAGIFTSTGTPLVKAKDVVQKGDVLVSGELTILNDETGEYIEYVHASAQIRARLYYAMNFTVPKNYTEKDYTGQTKSRYSVNIFGKDINLFNYSISYENYDKITKRTQLSIGENYPLPVIITTVEYKEYVPVPMTRNLDQMKELAGIMVTGRIIREFDFDADIAEKIIQYTQTDEGIAVNATIISVEDIGEEAALTIPEEPLMPEEDTEILE